MSDEYMIIIREPEWDYSGSSPAQLEADLAGHKAFQAAVAAAGQRITAGVPLRAQAEAFRITPAADGPVFTDGPFGETREVVTGFYVFTADSAEQARELATLVPTGGWLDVHPVLDMTAVRPASS
ncbi:YciI family protein [Microbacterium sp. KUDC0406]|uniref:YciI family protein n=1 Tax=Microbacterium sp. KUDC0406 TaxID=2909588 RepID=UPI001F311A92|nr:YciI family protein [Microbacterium sp. KUDC0406]UJP11237.1 YciI family protein [Microbacterium sp. KUDC0406]